MKTNNNNINNSKSSKTKSIIVLTSLILVLSIVNITLLTGTIFGININTTTNANALSYSTSEDISFTFAPTLSIGLSANSLTIDNLVPGTTNDSNTVTVTVSSNTPYGYVLSAGVGSNDTTSTYYNTSDLVHDNSTIPIPTTSKFTSIDTAASLSNLTTDNTWGYSTSTDGGTSWSTYSGLSHTTTKPLLDISDSAQPSTIDFKIAARSSTTQASGTYNNVITFYAVGKPAPLYMQDTGAIKLQLKNTGDELQAIDQRDGKEYWVARLADGNIWMTQNLDLDIEADRTYTSLDTDLSYSNIDTIWTPALSTDTTSSWPLTTRSPRSYDPGDLYWKGTLRTDWWYGLDSETVTDPSLTSGGTHYHIGNYYNWTAAVAMNDSSSYNVNQQDVNQSICPAGWRLPIYSGDKSYQNLANIQDLTSGAGGNMQDRPTYFVYGGVWSGTSDNDGRYSSNVSSSGYYLSSITKSRSDSYGLYFGPNGSLSPQNEFYRGTGYTLRCVMR